MKFALISHQVPPTGTGQSLVIYRMLQDFSPDDYSVISFKPHNADNDAYARSQTLPGRYHYLPPPFRINRGHRFGLRHLREGINIPLAVAQQAKRIARIVTEDACAAVVACTGDVTLLPAGYLASRRAGVPFYAYVFDHYSYREWADPAAAFWARRFEPFVMKGAAGVIAPNETLRDDLQKRFGIAATVIHNSCDIAPYETEAKTGITGSPRNEVRIVYTGAIYEAHYDAFRNLLAAITSLTRPATLHLYAERSQEDLEAHGIRGPVVYHPPLAATEVPRVQMEADLLFLPLAFKSPYPDLVRTSATTKLGEYLAARRPVLVHTPPDSFVSWYFREHNCGVVVDESDPARLAEGIELILADQSLQERLGANAWTRAQADFDIERSRQKFAELVGLNGSRNK